MKYKKLLLWFVKAFYLLNYIRYSSCNENKPRIVEIEQIDETSVWIQWDTSHMKDHGYYRRYDILNSTSQPFIRWPAQTELVDYDFMGGTAINQRGWTQMRTSQCRNMCLDNLNCLFARMDSAGCAHYVDGPQNIKYNDLRSNVEVFMMKDYSNNVIIRNVPYGRTHRFIVRVRSNEWSDSSDPVYFDSNINLFHLDNVKIFGETLMTGLKAELKRTAQNELTIEWHQDNQNGFKYNVSRYRVQIETKSDRKLPHKPIFDITYGNEDFEYYILSPNYDEIDSKYTGTGYSYANTSINCWKNCKENNGCVRFIYYPERTSVYTGQTVLSRSCFIRRNVDIYNGRLLPNTAVAYSIKSNQNKMIIGDLPFNDEYIFTVIGTTPFGDEFKSNEINFYFGDIPTFYIKSDNINLKIKIEWEYNKTVYAAQLNPTYFVNYTIGNQKPVTYAKGDKIDDIVINDALVETEYTFNIQILINKQYMLNIKPLKALIKFSTNILYSSLTARGIKLTCNHSVINRKYITKISWFKESKPVDFKTLQASQDKTSNDLILYPFNYKLHYGNYMCKVTVRDEQTIESDTLSDIKFLPKIQFLNVIGNRQTVVESDSVTITCVCERNPITEIRMKHNNVEINQDKLELVKEDSFTYRLSYEIDSFNISEHDGLYECHTTPDATHKDILILFGSVKPTSEPKGTIVQQDSLDDDDEWKISLTLSIVVILPVLFVMITAISIIIYSKYKKGGFKTEKDNIQVFYIDGYIVFEDPYENFVADNNNNNESRNATSNQLERNYFVRASDLSISVFSDLSKQNNSGYINELSIKE